MRVLIGNRLVDPEETPVVLYLTKQERENIANMADDSIGIYGTFDENMPVENRENIMETMKARLRIDGVI